MAAVNSTVDLDRQNADVVELRLMSPATTPNDSCCTHSPPTAIEDAEVSATADKTPSTTKKAADGGSCNGGDDRGQTKTKSTRQGWSSAVAPRSDTTSGRLLLGKITTQSGAKINSMSSTSSTRGESTTTTGDDGDDDAEEEAATTYMTRYRIDHEGQSEGLCRELMIDECVPFCASPPLDRGWHWAVVMWSWSVVRSELFLYMLHMLSIVLGALTEALGLRESDPTLALVHSSVETAATLLLIVIRMANAFVGYRAVRTTTRHEHDFDPDEDVHVRSIFRWMLVFEAIGLALFGFSLACFIVFYYHVHLGWTILTNNFCMITILVMATLYTARVVIAVTRLREDQHKVVIYEASYIIEADCQSATERYFSGDKTVNGRNSQPMVFIRAVRSTKLFAQPHYIDMTHDEWQEARTVSCSHL